MAISGCYNTVVNSPLPLYRDTVMLESVGEPFVAFGIDRWQGRWSALSGRFCCQPPVILVSHDGKADAWRTILANMRLTASETRYIPALDPCPLLHPNPHHPDTPRSLVQLAE